MRIAAAPRITQVLRVASAAIIAYFFHASPLRCSSETSKQEGRSPLYLRSDVASDLAGHMISVENG